MHDFIIDKQRSSDISNRHTLEFLSIQVIYFRLLSFVSQTMSNSDTGLAAPVKLLQYKKLEQLQIYEVELNGNSNNAEIHVEKGIKSEGSEKHVLSRSKSDNFTIDLTEPEFVANTENEATNRRVPKLKSLDSKDSKPQSAESHAKILQNGIHSNHEKGETLGTASDTAAGPTNHLWDPDYCIHDGPRYRRAAKVDRANSEIAQNSKRRNAYKRQNIPPVVKRGVRRGTSLQMPSVKKPNPVMFVERDPNGQIFALHTIRYDSRSRVK